MYLAVGVSVPECIHTGGRVWTLDVSLCRFLLYCLETHLSLNLMILVLARQAKQQAPRIRLSLPPVLELQTQAAMSGLLYGGWEFKLKLTF